MRAVAVIGFLWGGYTLTLYGYCLLRGYRVSLLALVDPRAAALKAAAHWPPPMIDDPTVLLP